MQISDEALGNDVYKIILTGRMDIEGVSRIEMRLSGMTAAPRKAVIVDLSAVPFLSSLGIRSLVLSAKGLGRRGGKMVLLNPDPNVRSVLTTAAIDQLIPVCDSLDEALAKLAS